MWAIRKPCLYGRDTFINLHDRVYKVSKVMKCSDTIILETCNEYVLSKFLLFKTKKEALIIFNKIQDIRKCTQ